MSFSSVSIHYIIGHGNVIKYFCRLKTWVNVTGIIHIN